MSRWEVSGEQVRGEVSWWEVNDKHIFWLGIYGKL